MNTLFERAINGKDEWLTPPSLIKRLGHFDLDPCSPVNRPWDTAATHLTIHDDGLSKMWGDRRVWLNPPYGSQTGIWLDRLASHGNGVALTFARTETRMFFKSVWSKADAVLFLRGRIKFYHVDGKEGGTAGAPSVLIAYGSANADSLYSAKDLGKFIQLTPCHR